MDEDVTIFESEGQSVTITESYSDEALGQFIDRLTSEPHVLRDFQQDPQGLLSGLGIDIKGDAVVTREQWISSIGENGLPGYDTADAMATGGESALLGPAIIIVAIVLYPSDSVIRPPEDIKLDDPNMNNINPSSQESSE